MEFSVVRQQIYGSEVHSELQLPGFDDVAALPCSSLPVELIIEANSSPFCTASCTPVPQQPNIFVGQQRLIGSIAALGQFHLTGERVIIRPNLDLTPAHTVSFALGSGLAVNEIVRGRPPMHGMAFSSGNHAALVLGGSGRGKSTLTAAMLYQGHPIFSDDILPISLHQNVAMINPAHRRLKLEPSLVTQLKANFDEPQRTFGNAYPHTHKQPWYAPAASFQLTPQPVSHCFVISPNRAPQQTLTITPIHNKAECFRVLKNQVYRPRLVQACEQTQQRLLYAAALVHQAQFSRIELPDLAQFSDFPAYAKSVTEQLLAYTKGCS